MTTAAIMVVIVVAMAIVLFATEWLRSDLVALLAMVVLILVGILTPEEGLLGFSNPATITVAFMFVISAAILKTGAMQFVALRLSNIFRNNFRLGMVAMMVLIAVISAFINNTPVVAVFIPVVLQIAHTSGQSPAKMLIPLSFASIFGGMTTLIGTSTNLLVSGIAEQQGLAPISMFDLTPIGVIMLGVGVLFMTFIGIRLLPNRKSDNGLAERYDIRKYLAEIELMDKASAVGKRIMDTMLVKELGIDIIEVRRPDGNIHLPSGDFVLDRGDILKVRCDVDKLKLLKDRERISVNTNVRIGEDDLKGTGAAMVELIVTANSEFNGRSLREMDFRRRFRGVPLGIHHRDEIMKESLYDVRLRPGDVILAEVKKHYVPELKKMETDQNPPFVVLSEDQMVDFDQTKFLVVLAIVAAMVILAALGLVNILTGVIAAVVLLVLLKCIKMDEVYEAVNWKVIFLMAGVLSFSTAMNKTGLDVFISDSLIGTLGVWGPIAVLTGIYFATSMLTEVMTNTAAAALMTPVAIAASVSADLNAMPFLVAVMLAASASFSTPIGYQTNTMVFSAGQYKFLDFMRVGVWLNLLFWLIATLLIPLIYPF